MVKDFYIKAGKYESDYYVNRNQKDGNKHVCEKKDMTEIKELITLIIFSLIFATILFWAYTGKFLPTVFLYS